MSLESALDEERREVMNILEGRPGQIRNQSNRPDSPSFGANGRNASPAPTVRSMLDIGGPAAPRHGSVAGSAVGVTSPPLRSPPMTLPGGVRSMLDTSSSSPVRSTHSVTGSPTEAHAPPSQIHRTQSDAASHRPDPRPRTGSDRDKVNPNEDYQFGMLPSVQAHAMPKRVSQGGKKQERNLSSMAAIMQGQELGALPRGRDTGRHNSTAGILGTGKSKSPSSRLGNRSQSPGAGLLNKNSYNLMPTPGKFVTDHGKVIDMNSAYRRLSDAQLLKSGGNLSSLAEKNPSYRVRLGSGETLSPTGEIRLQKDYYEADENAEGAIESSEEERSSDDDDDVASGKGRGRRKGRRKVPGGSGDVDAEESEGDRSSERSTIGMGSSGGPRKVKSLLAAAEEERLNVSSQYKVKSLLEPAVTITGPGGEKITTKKPGVHPNTNYNSTVSGVSSPATSDSEEMNDIRRAQRLAINMSPIDNSIPHRVIRTIVRGDYAALQKESAEEKRRIRTYLVATDISGEAAYALEWTIGTVLRDGDTLIAVYAVDEEIGTGVKGDADSVHGLPIGEGGQAMQDTAAIVGKLTAETQSKSTSSPGPSPLSRGALAPEQKDSRAGSTDSRYMSKAEQERFHAAEDISQTCIKFLRKTRLQVRIAIEVIHCKSPKHMITEAIDQLEPTLVILGSRGRSALKGVLLGSFSNYLVTKSSVPVMVARKKLQKPNSKNRLPNIRLANNLTPSKSLAEAKID